MPTLSNTGNHYHPDCNPPLLRSNPRPGTQMASSYRICYSERDCICLPATPALLHFHRNTTLTNAPDVLGSSSAKNALCSGLMVLPSLHWKHRQATKRLNWSGTTVETCPTNCCIEYHR